MNPFQCETCYGRHSEKECPVCVDNAERLKENKAKTKKKD